VAPYSFTTASTPEDEISSDLRALKPNNKRFFIFYDANTGTKSETDNKFFCVSFCEILYNLADW